MRYLFVFRVRGQVVRFRIPAPGDIVYTLGLHIAARLPPKQAKSWREALAGNEVEAFQKMHQSSIRLKENPWPIHAAVMVYPAKAFYGKDDLIFWELKLMGDHADHSFFLEVILPALETLSQKPLLSYKNRFSPWGKFDIQSVYTARGHEWVPLASDGRLDLRRRCSTQSWCKGMLFYHRLRFIMTNLQWMTPVCLARLEDDEEDRSFFSPTEIGNLPRLLEAWLSRASRLILGRWGTSEKLLADMDGGVRDDWQAAMDAAARVPLVRTEMKQNLNYGRHVYEGEHWYGARIPDILMPHLALASIFHVGRLTHYGCGSFGLSVEGQRQA